MRALFGVTFEAFDELAPRPMSADDALTLLPFLAGERTPNRPHASRCPSGISLTNLTPESPRALPSNRLRADLPTVLAQWWIVVWTWADPARGRRREVARTWDPVASVVNTR